MANRVRTHTRRKPGGGTTRVQQHSRTGRPRKGLVSAGHAWGLMKRAHRASRRKKTMLAVTLGVLGLGELLSWLLLDTTGLLLTTLAALATLGAAAALTATGRE
jgi:hypothetical protein